MRTGGLERSTLKIALSTHRMHGAPHQSFLSFRRLACSTASSIPMMVKTPPTTAHNCVTKSANDSFVSSYATLTGDT